MTFSPSNVQFSSKIKQNVSELVTDLSTDYFSSFIQHNCPKSWGVIPSPRRNVLSKELLNHSEVQRILCDMGTRLEGFMNIYSKQNPQFKDFVLKGSLSTYMDKPSPTSHFKKISYKCGTTTPNLTETRNVFTPVARHQSISETRTGLKSAAQQTRPSVSPQKGKPSEEKRSLSRKRLRTNSPSCKGNEQKGPDKEKKAGNSEQNNPYEIYFRSDLGQNFIQTVGKTEQIRENLSNFVAEMDERVTLEFAKTKASWREVEELFATKQRIVNILEEIIDKEHVSAEEMIGNVEDNWDLTEEYERYIADLNQEHQKEKDAIKQRFENRIFSLKESFAFEIKELEREIKRLKEDLERKEENHIIQLQIKEGEIETYVGKITLLQTQVYKLEERLKHRKQVNNAPSKMSKDSASQRNSEFTRKFDTPRSKKTTITNHGKTKSKVGSAQGNNRKSFLSNAPQIRIIQNIEEVQNNSSFIHPDHMLDVTSLNDDERSRLSVSSHEVSGQQMISISRRVSEDWEDEEKRKMKKLREFFIKLYEKVLSKKGGVTDSRTSLEGGSDEEGGSEDWGLDIYELISKQMANQELCDAAGVKVIDESNLLGRKSSISSLRKKMPNLLFHRRKKQNFNFEVIPENLKDENQDDKPEVVIFESCKEDLLEIIEGITNQQLHSEVKTLSIPKLFEHEVSIRLDKMLTIDDFKEDGQVPLSVYDVTIEQLIMNIMNFYLGLLGGKDEILRMFNSGKAVSKKIWKHVQTDNIDLQKVIIKTDQEIQVDITPPPTQLNHSSEALVQPPSDQEIEPAPMKILHESLNSWKKRLENLRHSGQKSSVFTRSSGQNSPQNYLNVPAQDKFGYQPKIPAEMLHLKLKKKFGTSLNESEKKSEFESHVEAEGAQKPFFYGIQAWKLEDIERERAVWRNILSEELFPKIAPMSSKLLDGDGSLGNINPAKPVNSGVAVKYLQAPLLEKPTNNKRDEIRNKILMEKSRFTSYKEERQIVELLEKPKQKKEEMNKNSNENYQKAKQQQENITELCKRTVLALYDYIVNAQKDLINPAKLKTDLYDVNKKVSEIEEMLQIGLADKKYSTLLGHFRQKGSMKSLADTDVGFYLEGKRREFRENINNALESRLLPGFNNRNKSILGHIKDTRSNSVKPTTGKEIKAHDERKPQEPKSISSHSKLEGFGKDENENTFSQFDIDKTIEKKYSPNTSIYGEEKGNKRFSLKQEFLEADGTPMIKDNFPLENEHSDKPLLTEGDEQKQVPIQNEFYQTISGNSFRDQMLHRLSVANTKVAREKLKQIEKGSKDRQPKKNAFKVKKVVLGKEKPSNDLNNTIL